MTLTVGDSVFTGEPLSPSPATSGLEATLVVAGRGELTDAAGIYSSDDGSRAEQFLSANSSDVAVMIRVTEELDIPTIGIGAGQGTDGQVLVWHDLLGLTPGPLPRFVRRYEDLGGKAKDAIERFAADVRGGSFPDDSESYSRPRPAEVKGA